MNERIQALIKQATECYSNGQERVFDKEKFAELIIEDCIDCIRGAGLTDEAAERNNLGFNDGISAAVINTQKHFGVD